MSKPKKGPAKKLKHGFKAEDYPRNLRWRVDYDYTHKLSPADKQWLQDFTEHHVGASFPEGEKTPGWDQEQRRAAYRAKNAANRGDLYGVSQSVGLLSFPENPSDITDPGDDKDWSETPGYLSSEAYRQLLAELRLAQDERPVDTLRVNNIRRQLERLAKLAP